MSQPDLKSYGMPLVQAARTMGLTVPDGVEPQDKFATVHGMRLHYLEWGTEGKEPMILLHGGAQTAHSWDFFALAMQRDYHVVALDQRGHGDSQWATEGDYSTEAHMRDIEGFIRHLGWKRLILTGLSMGGRNAFSYTALHPGQIQKLVVVDVGPEISRAGVGNIRRLTEQEDVLDSVETFVQRVHAWNPRRPIEQLRGSLKHNLRQLPDGRWTYKYDKRFRAPGPEPIRDDTEKMWGYFKSIKCPILIIRGGESDVLAPEQAAKMQTSNPRSRVVVVPGAGHLVQGDNPVDFERAVRAFLKEPG